MVGLSWAYTPLLHPHKPLGLISSAPAALNSNGSLCPPLPHPFPHPCPGHPVHCKAPGGYNNYPYCDLQRFDLLTEVFTFSPTNAFKISTHTQQRQQQQQQPPAFFTKHKQIQQFRPLQPQQWNDSTSTNPAKPEGERKRKGKRGRAGRCKALRPPLTVHQLEGAEDLALGRDALDVGVVLQREEAVPRCLLNLHHLEVAGVVTGRVLPPHDAPIARLRVPQRSADEVAAGLRREVAIKRHNVL